MWGTDHAMSLEKRGMEVLVSSIEDYQKALGSYEKSINLQEVETLSRTVGREMNDEGN